jgi:pyruvate dehydrogenase E2 component (dihydrolipoamide acetyltransferase)
VGTPLARIGEAGGTAAATAGTGSASTSPSGSTPDAVSAPVPAGSNNGSGNASAPAARTGGVLLSPLVRRLVAENGLDVGAINGTGVGGRIRREDVQQAVATGGARAGAAPAALATAPATAPARPAPVAAPTGATTAPAATTQPIPAGTSDPRDEVVTLSRMRLAVAGGMMASLANSASVWTSIEVDFDNVEKVRQKHKDRFKKDTGASLSYLPFVSRATIDALRAFPTVNSSIDIEAKTMTLHP